MKELGWSLWKQRWAVLIFAVTAVIWIGMIFQVTDGYSVFELCYRFAFVLLQILYLILQRERFRVVLRKEGVHKFYRSMPHAWEKERNRFLRLDLFCFGMLTVLLIPGIMCRNEFVEWQMPFALVVFFLIYMPSSRIIACVPYVWWLTDLVFAAMFLLMPALDISPLLCGGTAVVFGGIQVLLYGFVRKLWDTED